MGKSAVGPAGINRRLDFTITDQLLRRFWSRVAKTEHDDDCWNWTGCQRNGYGCLKHERKAISTHRIAYLATYGNPEPGLIIGHKCDNKICCNPKHLEAITAKRNNIDARARVEIRGNVGIDCHNAVLTDQIVGQIKRLRDATGYGATRIIDVLGLTCDRRTVEKVISGETWSHVSGATA